jgi:hypothetical protein
VQLPAARDAEFNAARRLHAPLAAADERVLVVEEFAHDDQHGIALARVRVRRDDRGEMQGVLSHPGNLRCRQSGQVGGQDCELGVAQGVSGMR